MMKIKHQNNIPNVFVLAFFIFMILCPLSAFGGGSDKITQAVAVLHPTQGNDVQGIVRFSQMASGVKIVADISGLTPGKHGFHIHEYGDCSAADGKSAGGHFNPTDQPHGGPDQKMRHVGDLGNLEANSNGNAHYERLDSQLMLNGQHTIIGRGVIVHAGADDLTSQPSGAAGDRQACGVVGASKP